MERTRNVELAVAELARELGLDQDAIEVVSQEEVTWRDGSIGCPQPGMMYTQALVPGYRIHLRANGIDVWFHGRDGHPPLRCDKPDWNGTLPPPWA